MGIILKFRKLVGASCLLILFVAATSQTPKNVLIVGDSISIGYTPFVKSALAPNVNVEHNFGNGGPTTRGVDSIETWLDDREWDVVVFNFGLHDMVYKDVNRKYDAVNGKISVSLDNYRKNLEIIVAKLRETTAKLVFVNTTVVPEGAIGRKVESSAQFNKVAEEVMAKNGIEVIDLYSISAKVHQEHPRKKGNVHYTATGYQLLAQPIINRLKTILSVK